MIEQLKSYMKPLDFLNYKNVEIISKYTKIILIN